MCFSRYVSVKYFTPSLVKVYMKCVFSINGRGLKLVENLLYNLCPITEHSYGETLRYARTEKTQDLSQICKQVVTLARLLSSIRTACCDKFKSGTSCHHLVTTFISAIMILSALMKIRAYGSKALQ